ncbi:CLUMA_CG005120, isoform A [Clunio marinus]|uniref:CLUMA_CG005120, isoform A n=1 Tax=Clunio marinus TaxID=568069 RepID=A0A1J1HTX7_9DIPT|nr:CLUMA_CG005120, isoform A [Clunio marinus]
MFVILLTLLAYLLVGLMIGIGVWHVWLRTTVGKFQSDETMTGKTVLITGGNSGLGLETVRDLARRGARIIMASRKIDVGMKVRDEIIEETGNKNIIVRKLDLSSFQSVRDFSSEILKTEKKIDVLIHNSGCASTSKKRKSVDGLEMTMATNHYGPFLLTHLLIDLLKESTPCRILIVSSAYYKIARVDLNNLNPLDTFPFYLYYVTKTANIMFGLELAKRLKNSNITVNFINPGMCSTAIFKKVPFPLNLLVKYSFKNAKEGAQTTIMCSVSKLLQNKSGKYFSDCRETSLMNFVKDDVKNKKFWEESIKIVQLKSTDPQI